MPGDGLPFIAVSDPAIERFSAFLADVTKPQDFRSTLILKSIRIAVDVTIIETSVLTLGIAQCVMPVLPGWTKVNAVVTASLAALSLVAASADILLQLSEIQSALLSPKGLSDAEIVEASKIVQKLAAPISSTIDKVIETLGRMGLIDKESADLVKAAKSFADAMAKADKATNPADKLKYGLKALEAYRKFLEKLPEVIKKKLQKDEYDTRKKLLDDMPKQFPKGVDYPNPPIDQGPDQGNGNGGVIA